VFVEERLGFLEGNPYWTTDLGGSCGYNIMQSLSNGPIYISILDSCASWT